MTSSHSREIFSFYYLIHNNNLYYKLNNSDDVIEGIQSKTVLKKSLFEKVNEQGYFDVAKMNRSIKFNSYPESAGIRNNLHPEIASGIYWRSVGKNRLKKYSLD